MQNLLELNDSLVLDSLGDGVYVTDVDRKITYWNKAAERITGWKRADRQFSKCFFRPAKV